MAYTIHHAVCSFNRRPSVNRAHFRLIPGVLFIITMFFQPESPRWLVEHQKEEAAARSLAFASRTSPEDDDVLRTIGEIKASFAGKEDPPLSKQFLAMGESRVIALRCFIPSLVMFFQQVNKSFLFRHSFTAVAVDWHKCNQLFQSTNLC